MPLGLVEKKTCAWISAQIHPNVTQSAAFVFAPPKWSVTTWSSKKQKQSGSVLFFVPPVQEQLLKCWKMFLLTETSERTSNSGFLPNHMNNFCGVQFLSEFVLIPSLNVSSVKLLSPTRPARPAWHLAKSPWPALRIQNISWAATSLEPVWLFWPIEPSKR